MLSTKLRVSRIRLPVSFLNRQAQSMQTVLLTVLLLVALALTVVVLMQRSEGGGLGIGGGGGGGAMTGRSAANAMTKLTWILAIAFFGLSIALTVIASNEAGNSSVVDRVAPATDGNTDDVQTPSLLGDDLLPPTAEDAPAAPPKAE